MWWSTRFGYKTVLGQNPKIVQIWRPVALQLYIVEKSWPDLRNSLAVGLQREVNSISAVHPMICSLLWVRCLFDGFLISDFWDKLPLKWKFSKMPLWIPWRDTELCFVTKFGESWPLRSCRKVLWITTHEKTPAPRDSSQPPFCQKWADRAQNSLSVVTPWHVHLYWIWSGSAALCRTYTGKIDFSAPKVTGSCSRR